MAVFGRTSDGAIGVDVVVNEIGADVVMTLVDVTKLPMLVVGVIPANVCLGLPN